MTLLIFALFVLLIAALAIYAIDRAPVTPNFRWVLVVLVCIVAGLALAYRAGFVT